MNAVHPIGAAVVVTADETSIAAAYLHCENIAKREAKNFYYAFRILPRAKRDAMCAIYAFMRRADDIADDESVSISSRRVMMATWLASWRASSLAGNDPVFVAVRDTQRNFSITDDLLEKLICGTTMDLSDTQAGVVTFTRMLRGANGAAGAKGPQTLIIYDRFNDLYRYCYLVASVVGLVCIRIFGYQDPSAELLAEKVGVAFQLTNILRDIKEDCERGRIYIPLEDLAATHIEAGDLLSAASSGGALTTVRPVLALEAGRAKSYYKAADELIPLLDADSRAAMWVLVTIYRELLEEIHNSGFDVFSRRLSVSSSRKIAILFRGAAKSMRDRVLG